MKEEEVKAQMARIVKYRELEKLRDEIQGALTKVSEDWKDTGPSGQGPFTGNTRESRRVRAMKIYFSETRGGAVPVEIEIPNMHIEAWELGEALQTMLRVKLNEVNAMIENL